MSVVRRCPNCGTTKETSGECDACHEAQVRYFCTNHTPGIWLEAQRCPECGARLGEPAHRASAPPPAPRFRKRSGVPVPARPVRTRPPARAPASTSERPPYSPAVSRKASADGWGSREGSPLAGEPRPEAGTSRMALWQQLLQAALRAREMRVRAAPDRDGPAIARRAGGCLMRLVLFIVLLLVALAVAGFLFGRALLGF